MAPCNSVVIELLLSRFVAVDFGNFLKRGKFALPFGH